MPLTLRIAPSSRCFNPPALDFVVGIRRGDGELGAAPADSGPHGHVVDGRVRDFDLMEDRRISGE